MQLLHKILRQAIRFRVKTATGSRKEGLRTCSGFAGCGEQLLNILDRMSEIHARNSRELKNVSSEGVHVEHDNQHVSESPMYLLFCPQWGGGGEQ